MTVSKQRTKLRSRLFSTIVPVPRVAAVVAVVVTMFVGVGIYSATWEPSARSSRLQFQQQVNLYASDEFSGPAGSAPNPKLWQLDSGGGGWGNDEEQVYKEDNVRIDGAGHLVIEARRDNDVVTSARVTTRTRFHFQRGMIQARIKMPKGQGIQPAFWMLGTSIMQARCPDCGEIDIAETVNSDGVLHAALHGPWLSKSARPDPKWKLSAETRTEPNLSDDFHIYWLRKEPGHIAIGVDDLIYGYFRKEDTPEGGKWVHDSPFYVVLNVAVGGHWPGDVSSDALPAQMLVDWIRVYG